MKNHELIKELENQALVHIEEGGPEEAETILKAAELLCEDENMRRKIHKALEQVQMGTLQEAENILTCL